MYFICLKNSESNSLAYLDESSSENPNRVHCIEEIKQGGSSSFAIGTDKFLFVAAIQVSTGPWKEQVLQLLQVYPILGVTGIHKIFSDEENLKCIDLILGKIIQFKWKQKGKNQTKNWWEINPPAKGFLKSAFLKKREKPSIGQIKLSELTSTQSDVTDSKPKFDIVEAKPGDFSFRRVFSEKDMKEMSPQLKQNLSAISDDSSDYTISVPDTCPNVMHATITSSGNQLDSCLLNFSVPNTSKMDNELTKPFNLHVLPDKVPIPPREQPDHFSSPILSINYAQTFNLPFAPKKLGYFSPLQSLVIDDQFTIDFDGKSASGVPAIIDSESIVINLDETRALSYPHGGAKLWRHSNSHGTSFRFIQKNQLILFSIAEDVLLFKFTEKKFARVPSLLQNISFNEFYVGTSSTGSTVACISKSEEGNIELRHWHEHSDSICRSNLSKICKIR